jgi:beta-phosphoglucomutase-like phosphatase (HAD superfamily)
VGYRDAIFDIDGVLVDSPHERAWRNVDQDGSFAAAFSVRGATGEGITEVVEADCRKEVT